MNRLPEWLPEPLRYSDYNGQWERFLAKVYAIFVRDFKDSRAFYEHKPVVYDTRVSDGKEEGFWHLVSYQDRDRGERLFDFRRCERIPWPRSMIDHAQDPNLSVWEDIKRTETRILIWFEAMDYLVVLARKPRAVILITAYCTDRNHTRIKLRKERQLARKRQAPPT